MKRLAWWQIAFNRILPYRGFGSGFWERRFSGHINIGPIVIYGWNAMHVAINIRTKRWGYICFHPTFRVFGQWWSWYFYVSRDATPQSASYRRGPGLWSS